MMYRTIFAAVLAACLAGPATAVVIDHRDIEGVASLPQATMDAIGQQKWLFTHASVGGNMVNGMRNLHSADPARYQLVIASVGYDSALERASDPPAPTLSGRIYECGRGNPGWETKINIFANSVTLGGWHDPAVNVAMDKFCYIDQEADANTYLNTMAGLEASYPTTVFVYTTMPLMTSEDSSNVLRNQYNAAVRAFCAGNNKLLFDIADMEAHDPAGNPCTFASGGNTYQKLCEGYTSDGGHLNTAGSQGIATGWYAVAAAIAGNAPVPNDTPSADTDPAADTYPPADTGSTSTELDTDSGPDAVPPTPAACAWGAVDGVIATMLVIGLVHAGGPIRRRRMGQR